METTLIEAVPVVRGADGSWWHPAMPDFEEGQNEAWNAWIAEQGLDISRGMLEDESDDHPVYVEYFEKGASSFLGWVDSPPSGDGWFTLAIQDTEDGPVWCWARRIGSSVAPAPTEQAVQPDGILTPIPLVEPVSIGKALLAHREAHVVLNSGVGPLAAVHLVNIGLTGWTHNAETATAYAKGYNTALKQYRGALAARQAPDSRNVWTDQQREQFRRDRKDGPRCEVCTVVLGGQHFPGCSKEGT